MVNLGCKYQKLNKQIKHIFSSRIQINVFQYNYYDLIRSVKKYKYQQWNEMENLTSRLTYIVNRKDFCRVLWSSSWTDWPVRNFHFSNYGNVYFRFYVDVFLRLLPTRLLPDSRHLADEQLSKDKRQIEKVHQGLMCLWACRGYVRWDDMSNTTGVL